MPPDGVAVMLPLAYPKHEGCVGVRIIDTGDWGCVTLMIMEVAQLLASLTTTVYCPAGMAFRSCRVSPVFQK